MGSHEKAPSGKMKRERKVREKGNVFQSDATFLLRGRIVRPRSRVNPG